eukprot:gene39856-49258_t
MGGSASRAGTEAVQRIADRLARRRNPGADGTRHPAINRIFAVLHDYKLRAFVARCAPHADKRKTTRKPASTDGTESGKKRSSKTA